MAGRPSKSGPAPTLAAGPVTCRACSGDLDEFAVCGSCGRPAPLTAWQRIEQLADRGSFAETDRHLWSADPLSFSDGVSYERRIAEAQAATQLLDAVVTGRARILDLPVALAVFDFRFLGGSMGSVVGEKVARAFDLARRDRLPAIVVCSSGGARIQEGMVALFQMARTAAAAARLREQGIPLITVMADPTMGGVLASFASLGDVILAEPGARVSFVGPRVHERALGNAAPPGTAEFALRHGTIDAIVERAHLRHVVGALASMLRPHRVEGAAPESSRRAELPAGPRSVWETVELARHPDRPSGRALVASVLTDVFELHGDRQGEDDDSVMAAVGRLGDRAVVVVAQDRKAANEGHTRPSGYRKAQRAFTIAERFRLPLFTFVDTPGAATDAEAEAAGVTGAIAECLARLARLRTPVIGVVIGEGGSGGALALSVGDRLLMLENAIFSVIAPEAASAILYRDADHAHQLATSLKVTAGDLVKLRLVDRVVPEQPPAHEAPELMATILRQILVEELGLLSRSTVKTLLQRRESKSRHVRQLHGRFRLLVRNPLHPRARAHAPGVGGQEPSGAGPEGAGPEGAGPSDPEPDGPRRSGRRATRRESGTGALRS